MFHASMRCASTSATAHAIAWERIRSDNSVRRSGSSFLESSSPTMRRFGLRITAAATTGPNSAPRPASSRPAMRIQPSRRAARSKREEQSRAMFVSSNPNSSTKKMKKGQALACPPRKILWFSCLGFGCGHGRRSFFAGGALDAGGFAPQVAQVIEARAADVSLANYVDGSNRGRGQREDAFDANAKTHAADGKAGAAGAALLRNHHPFKRLDAFLDLFAFTFQKAHMHLDGVAGTELGKIFAQLRFMQLLNYRIHFRYSLQTHSGGASTSETTTNYRQTITVCLAVLACEILLLLS